jgi:hypothetical protein
LANSGKKWITDSAIINGLAWFHLVSANLANGACPVAAGLIERIASGGVHDVVKSAGSLSCVKDGGPPEGQLDEERPKEAEAPSRGAGERARARAGSKERKGQAKEKPRRTRPRQ